MNPYAESLRATLRRREEIIADHAWRDRDSAGHLDALKEVSEAITRIGTEWRNDVNVPLPPRLRHFLDGCSYQKALAFLAGE